MRVRGKEMLVFHIWHALFLCNNLFELPPFALLPRNDVILVTFLDSSKLAFICLKSIMETPYQFIKFVQILQ